jgi:hypothetical protein
MRIEQLYRKHCNDDIYVVGTGPSMRCFPMEFLRGRVTIGLNQAFRYFAPTYSITVHPELVLEYLQLPSRPATQWLIKKKPPMKCLELDDPSHYVFHTSEDWNTLRARPRDTLFLGRGVQCTAMDMAARMGARTVILVGCDHCDLCGDHHGHDQHVRFYGLEPDIIYKEYRRYTAKVRKALREAFGVQTLTLSPFVGLDAPQEDYQRLCLERGLSRLPPPRDTSPYRRARPRL